MANNLVIDRRRGQRRAMARDRTWLGEHGGGDALVERSDPADPADETIARREEAEIIHQALSALPPRAQRAVRLHRLDGHSQAEVARLMGISRSGVEKHLALAMRRLRDALADCGYFAPAASECKEGGERGIAAESTEP
jgi:RNA polymerase sigma-70 factor (ECF subfamily)